MYPSAPPKIDKRAEIIIRGANVTTSKPNPRPIGYDNPRKE